MSSGRRNWFLLLSLIGAMFGSAADSRAEVKLIIPPGYLPGVPFLARVEVRDGSGGRDWNLWNADALLSADQPGITLSTNRVVLRNGLGTALLTINGSADFSLSATVNSEQASRSVRNLSSQPVTTASGTLAGGSTSWSGVVHVTGDITVSAGHTLTIQPSTVVIINGVASGTSGIDINVDGTIQSLGTELNPVTITCADSILNWGQIRHNNAQPSIYQHTFISKAGRAPGEGHTGTGPALRPTDSTITFESCVISDLTADGSTIGKIMQANRSTLTLRDCVLARARMGPEIAGTGLVCTNSYIMEMSGPDDADGIYLHSAAGRSLTLSGCVLVSGTDDAIDTLDSNVTIENCIIRDWPNPNEDAKGVSAFHGEVTLRRCLIVNCFTGVAVKSDGPLAVVRIDHCTITGIDKGVSAPTKSNASAGNINIYMSNSIVRAADAMHSDFGPEKFVSVNYCDLSETWPGSGNITGDPLFANSTAGDFHLQPGSPGIDAGDPAFAFDADGSQTDLGFYTAKSQPSPLFVTITSPSTGAIFVAPTNITLSATAGAATGTVSRVEFFEGATRVGIDTTSPFSVVWSNVPVGTYTVRAVAAQASGLMATSGPVTISVTSGGGPSTNILIAASSDWKFLDDGSDQGTAWRQTTFNDQSWKSGKAQFGYGDGDEATVVSFGPSANNRYTTTYFRRTFPVTDIRSVAQMTVRLLRDDGGVVYLNGTEVFRSNMPAGTIASNTFASANATPADETTNFFSQNITPGLLVEGENVLAVEIHQVNLTSTDLTFDLELAAVITAPANARPVVSITSPANNTTFAAPANFTILANAADVDGTIAIVGFYANGGKLDDVTTPPYGFAWNSVAAGNYALTARTMDATGLSATSSVVNVTVSANVGPPIVASRSPSAGTVANLKEISVIFSKAVVGVDASDLLLNGLPATEISGSGNQYVFTFVPPAPGTASVTWSPSHGITDTFTPANAFNASAAGAAWQYQTIDTSAPSMQTLIPAPSSSVAKLTNIIVTFSEPVTGVSASDLLINSAPATGFTGSGAGPYTFNFSQPPKGTVALAWAGSHGIQDQANNLFGGGSWSYLLDTNSVDVVISEIMYHPSSENPLEEYIELFNRGASPVNLQGWHFSDGVEFAFPSVSIPAGGYLVVAADLAVFRSKYPSVNNVIGNWTGLLSNNSEDIDLDDAQGTRVDSVIFAEEGDWAVRRRGRVDRNHRGWEWFAEHDGLGRSLELINPNISNNNGQNWAASLVQQGTPGRANSVLKTETAPLIESVGHFPLVPRSTEAIRVMAKITDETGRDLTVTLNYRVDRATPPPFAAIAMGDDGLSGDASAGDGIFTAALPAQANNSVIEFYVTASDALGNTRTWPAPAIAAPDGAGPTGQVVNALLQVDDTVYAGNQPLYKMIMTETERAELAIIPSQSSAEGPNSQMNGTFISLDGTGSEVQYLSSFRNRGHGSRTANPPNYHVAFRTDDPWKGIAELNLNSQQVHLQHLGSTLALKAGAAGTSSRAVQVRVNNVNRANAGGGMFGSYAANEVYGADWADRHFPFDGEGNVYKVVRDIDPPNFNYRGPNINSYTNTYFKESNASVNDWTDLIGMLQIMGENSGALLTLENMRKVINLEQWLTHLAVMAVFSNGESGLNTGNNDDYFMYFGLIDRRAILMFHDLDQILGGGGSLASNSDIFRNTLAPISGDTEGAFRALSRFLHAPDIEPLYYATLQRLLDTTFSKPQFDALADQVLGSYVPQANINSIKSFMDQRRTYVRSRLPAVIPGQAPVAVITDVPRSPTPATSAFLAVSGSGVTHYRFSLNGGPFSAEEPVDTAISILVLSNGTNRVSVIGRNASGIYQSEAAATVASWVVDSGWPTVRLNEIMARRSGNLPDQIELYNEGPNSVNLGGMRLTDDASQTNKFTFSSVTLPAGGYLVLDSNQLGFSFSESGEALYLLNSVAGGGALLDSVEFGFQLTDLSIGRIGTAGDWRLTKPTFGAANVFQPLGNPAQLKINEWLTSGVSPYPDDFVELYNPDSLPVALGGLYVTDQPIGAPARSRITPASFISPGGYVVFSSGNGNSSNEINFDLASEQGELALFAADLSLIDSVAYGPQRSGLSNGRCPDGGPAQRALEAPTPGGPNLCPVTPAVPQMVNLLPFDYVWKYDASRTDLGTAWRDSAYDDSTWSSGPGALGAETNPLAETLRTAFPNVPNTAYFRTQFNVNAGLSASVIQVTHLIDDGAAFYLNGREIGRYNLPANATYQSFASANLGDATIQVLTFPADQLRSGANVLAVEVHQINATSTDLVFGLRMDALVVTNTAAQAGVLINEVLTDNTTLADTDGSNPDWVEIYNPSANSVDLAGMSLSDGLANPRRWSFPNGSLLSAKGFLKIRFNPDAPVSDANTGFGLRANGGAVFLFNKPADGGGLQSSVTYGLQPADWSIGRMPDGGTNWVLTLPTLGAANIVASLGNPQLLKINEWMADPASGEDWFEIFNPNPQPVEISRFWLSDGLSDRMRSPLPPLSYVGNGASAFQKFEADEQLNAGADHVGFKLSASGEALALSTANGTLIDGVSFGPQLIGVAQGRLPDGGGNIVNFTTSATPANSNFLPLGNVVINELLSHSDPPLTDAVELFNPSASAADISGWFLSDSAANLRKFPIPANTIVPPGGYVVLYEPQFNGEGPISDRFSFSSAKGDEVFLSQSINGVLTGYRASASFGASENGVSFGRVATSQGFHFVPLVRRTFGRDNPATTIEFMTGTGAANASAKVGSVVISEIMYHPADANDALEFVELHNISAASVPLYDPANPSNTWRLRKGIDFDFPPNTSIPAGGLLIVVSFDPRSASTSAPMFQSAYGTAATLIGPYQGRLSDGGDAIELQRPDAPQTLAGPDFGLVPYIVVDRIDYDDAAPWPVSADGAGHSLQKVNHLLYGNDPANWTSAVPNPGTGPATPNDSDNDGIPNDWETANGLNPNDPADALADADSDGMNNLQEYVAGTNPRNAASALKANVHANPGGALLLEFTAAANRAYAIEFRDSLAAGLWQKLTQIDPSPSERNLQLPITVTGSIRFFRVVAAPQP
jgi:hypothetical protein